MTVIMFDLGNTLEREGEVVPGAREMLLDVRAMLDGQGDAPVSVLVSDFTMPGTSAEIPALKQQYYDIVEKLGLGDIFKPFDSRVTLSTEVGAFKPDARIFRRAIDKVSFNMPFGRSVFLTENQEHVVAARQLQIAALQLKTPGHPGGDVDNIVGFASIVRSWLDGLP